MKTVLALLSAACLCAHGAAQAQSSTPVAPKAARPTPPAGKLPAVPARPGSGQTASLSESEGSSCPVDGAGESQCVVVSSGSSSGGGGSYTPPEPGGVPGGVMSGDGAGGTATGGGAPGPVDPKLARWIQCGDAETAAQAQAKADYDFELARCARDNPDSSGSIGVGVTVNGTGATVTLPWDLIRNPAAKRAECETAAKDKWQSAARYNKAVADSCRAKVQRGG